MSVFSGNEVGTFREVNLHDGTVADISTEAFGLFAQFHHHLVAVHSLRIAGEILDGSGLGELSARLQTAVFDGVQVSSGSVDGGGISGRTASDDETFGLFHDLLLFE